MNKPVYKDLIRPTIEVTNKTSLLTFMLPIQIVSAVYAKNNLVICHNSVVR